MTLADKIIHEMEEAKLDQKLVDFIKAAGAQITKSVDSETAEVVHKGTKFKVVEL